MSSPPRWATVRWSYYALMAMPLSAKASNRSSSERRGWPCSANGIMALLHGEPRYLTAEELEVYNADQRFPMRGWEYYVSRLEGKK